ncbi:excinuclease ABC subunit UvrC [Dongia soli]|uniref:UvrABC system protein C n=1 Tax=Dongia soli TaxID=600628 RepID=A0ABU5E6R5_9PROT|nr:excinuclease ABC subunit UvrC [Dongia soli]MDY0881330.1 excinuclease ABC subunit UvrC [Dongia soli]
MQDDTSGGREKTGPGEPEFEPEVESGLEAAVETADPEDQDEAELPVLSGRLASGVAVIREKARTLPGSPGCYRMLNAQGDVLYVGKAKDLKKRVTSYTQPYRQPMRLQRMIAETATMEFVTTHTEVEALLLEANLIKRYMPRYNVLLRDDKSFPYILITADHPAPQIAKHRGARNRPGEYFGPFASAGAVNRTIVALQRAFLLRPCSDSIFASRTRPCLQYQIKRCSAPCVKRISEEDYAELVREARDFLTGKSRDVQNRLAQEMQSASDALEFERAAKLRDRIQALTMIQSRQDINLIDIEEADIIAAVQEGGQSCIQVFFFRNGSNYGSRAYFPAHDKQAALPDILAAFMGQFYENKTPPRMILVSDMPAEADLLTDALSLRAGGRVEIVEPKRGDKRKPVEHALLNAREALARRSAESSSQQKLMRGVASVFGLEQAPKRIEVYDNSHISGTNAYGAMIVAGPEGFLKNQYRKFSIRQHIEKNPGNDNHEKAATAEASPTEEPGGLLQVAEEDAPDFSDPSAITGIPGLTEDIVAGDDYGMMRQVLMRRFGRALKEDPDRQRGTWPDLVLIDGGQGQLQAALDVFAELGISDVTVAAIAKGPDRNAGRERFFMPDRDPFSLDMKDPVLYYLQRLRDESHRFVIGTHRAKRSKQIGQSLLDEVPGIGAKRKKALLLHFGSARAVARAGLADLCEVEGISEAVARKIYDHFHGG